MVTVLPPPPPKQSKGFLNSLLQGAAYAVGPAVENYQNSKKQSAAEEQKFQREMQKLQMQYDLDRRNKLEQLSGQKEKPLNELQQAQADLARQKTDYYKSESDRLNKITGDFGNEDESFSNKIMREPAKASQDLDLSDDEYDQFSNAKQEKQKPKENPNDMRTWSKERLNRARALKGSKNARASEIGTQAENTFQEMEQEKKVEKEEQKLKRETKEKEENNIRESFKLHKPYIDEVRKAYKGSKEEGLHLDVLENLRKKKTLTTPLMYSLLGKLGIPLGALNNPDSELFEKTGVDLTKNVKDFYGSRPTNLDVSLYLRSIPTLENSDEGKQVVIDGIRLFKEPKKMENQIVNDLLKEYEGKQLPLNFEGEVQQRMEAKYDEVMNKIKQMGRQRVQPGTPLDKNITNKYLEISGGNPDLAEQMAQEDGYVW